VEVISFEAGVALALTSLLSDRLSLLAGAGLSMAPPSSLPSAGTLAWKAKQKYDATYCPPNDPLPAGIEEQCDYLFHREELASIYFKRLLDPDAFAGRPNAGHYCVADLMLVRGIKIAVTTNVDTMIETAGQWLYGQIDIGLDGLSVAAFPHDVVPLLKLHGCRTADPNNMVWAPAQIEAPPVSDRIASSSVWLQGRLPDSDLLVVGYATDWDYLNGLLAKTLGTISPVRVIVVNKSESEAFVAKAPELTALGQRATVEFLYVKASGADFLEALRLEFSKSFVRQVLHAGQASYQGITGNPPAPELLSAPALSNDDLWAMRRDLEGRAPNRPSIERAPTAGPLLGFTLIQLRAKGAQLDGPFWMLGDTRIRVIRAEGKMLHEVQAEFENELAPILAPDVIVAVGAEFFALPTNFARPETPATIARGTVGRWLTRQQAETEFLQ
jgi:hypothetical protein